MKCANPRICPDETVLSEYVCGALEGPCRNAIEEHLAECATCRVLVAGAFKLTERPHMFRKGSLKDLPRDLWIYASLLCLGLSFLFPRHFLQFIVTGTLLALKWILAPRALKTLVMIQGADKSGSYLSHTGGDKER